MNGLATGLAIAVGLNVAILFALTLAKLHRQRREAYQERIRTDLTERLIPLLEENDARLALPAPRSRAAQSTLETAISLIAMLKGQAREVLVRMLEEQGYVAALLDDLRARDDVKRARIASLLGGSGSRLAVPALSEAFRNDRSAEVRIVCAEALGAIGDAPSIELLLVAARDPTRYQELRLAGVLSRIGMPALPALENILHDKDTRLVTLALDILIDIGAVSDTQHAIALLEHRSPEVRARAAALLGAAGAVDAISALVFATRDRFWFVRLRIIKALAQLGVPDREAVRSLYFDALTHLLYDDSWHVRRNAAAGLAAGGDLGISILSRVNSDVAQAAIAFHELHKGRRMATVF